MATVVTWNALTYSVPAVGEENWGGTTGVDGLLISLANNGFQKTGGTFTLSADVDFGVTAGLKSLYYKSRGTVATAGVLRLAKTEAVAWLNNAGGGNNTLATDTSDQLLYNGVVLAGATGIVPVAAGGTGIASYTIGDTLYASGATTLSKLAIGTSGKVVTSNGTAPGWNLITNTNIDAAAAIAYSKLNLTGSVVNADINASAAIAYSKLTLTGSIVNADVNASAAIAYSKLNLGTSILNADVSASAAIVYSKLNLATAVKASDVNSQASLSGTVLTADGAGNATFSTPVSAPDASSFYTNGSISASVSGNALTVALKDKSGSNASGGSAVQIGMRNSTATTGTYNYRSVTAALSVVVPDSTTLGMTASQTSYLFVYAIDNAGTVELAVSPSGYWDEQVLQTTVAVSGGSSLTSIYSTTARSSVPIRLIGRIQIAIGATSHWSNSPTEVSNLPVERLRQVVVGVAQTSTSSITTGTYQTLANSPVVTFTAQRTGTYKIYGSFLVENNTASDSSALRIQGTSGSPTVVFSQEVQTNAFVSSQHGSSISPFVIAILAAGTSYTFTLQAKIDAGTGTLRNDLPTNGQALVAEEL